MHPFKIHSARGAPPPSDELLEAVNGMLGFVPNVFAVIAESPPALRAFVNLNQQFAQSDFSAASREIIQTAASVENQCAYCVAGHTTFAEMQGVPIEVIDAVRGDRPITDSKLEALNRFTRSVVRNQGMIPKQELRQFLTAGYTPKQVLDVILGISVKTFSNLANNLIGIPLDDEFAGHKWRIVEAEQAAL